MRALIMIVVIVLAVIYLGGVVQVGGRPIFAQADRLIGINLFMGMHHVVFFFLETGEEHLMSNVKETESDIEEFSKRPIGIDNPKKYRELDEAASFYR